MVRRRMAVPTIDLDKCGTVILACGSGSMGQLGHGEEGRLEDVKPRKVQSAPIDVPIAQVAAGSMHSALLTADHRIFMCGANDFGAVPVAGVAKGDEVWEYAEMVLDDKIVKEHGKPVRIACGASVTAILTSRGSVVAWGYLRNSSGTMNTHALFESLQRGPTVIVQWTDHRCVRIACGDNHIVALADDGHIVTFGDGEQGQLGRMSTNRAMRSTRLSDTHQCVSSMCVYDDIFAGSFWTAAVNQEHSRSKTAKSPRLYMCGLNNYAQLGVALKEVHNSGDGTTEAPITISFMQPSPAFAKVEGEGRWADVAGDHHIVGIRSDGSVHTVGRNQDHRLGTGSWTQGPPEEHWREMQLQKVELPSKAIGVTVRSGGSAVWCEDGYGYSWGCDTCGQLGVGLGDGELVPRPQRMISKHLDGLKIVQIALAEQHTIVLAKER